MDKRKWIIFGIIIVIGIIIAGCTSAKAENDEAHSIKVWSDQIHNDGLIPNQYLSEVQIPEHNMTCFVIRSGEGVAMQCFSNNDIYDGGK